MSFSTGLLLGKSSLEQSKSIAIIDLPGEVILKVKHWEWSRSCLLFFLQLQLRKHLQSSLTTLKYFPCLNGILGLKPVGLCAPSNNWDFKPKTTGKRDEHSSAGAPRSLVLCSQMLFVLFCLGRRITGIT